MPGQFFGVSLETLLKMITPLVVAIIAYLQRRFLVRPRARLRADLEMIGLFQGDDLKFELEKVKSSVSSQVDNIYGARGAERYSVKLAVFGAIWTLVFSYITLRVYHVHGWGAWYWLILTGFLTLAGIGWMGIGLERRTVRESIKATAVAVNDQFVTTTLNDGRRISVPLEWYPELARCTPEIRQKVKLTNQGQALYWEDIDASVSLEWILLGERSLLKRAGIRRDQSPLLTKRKLPNETDSADS